MDVGEDVCVALYSADLKQVLNNLQTTESLPGGLASEGSRNAAVLLDYRPKHLHLFERVLLEYCLTIKHRSGLVMLQYNARVA